MDWPDIELGLLMYESSNYPPEHCKISAGILADLPVISNIINEV